MGAGLDFDSALHSRLLAPFALALYFDLALHSRLLVPFVLEYW